MLYNQRSLCNSIFSNIFIICPKVKKVIKKLNHDSFISTIKKLIKV